MIAQRPSHLVRAVQASAERLPFEDREFDGALAILTIHHWRDPVRGLEELRRVTAGPLVIVTFDPERCRSWWLPSDYGPELVSTIGGSAPSLSRLLDRLGSAEARVLPVPARCSDAFLMAFWDRPELVVVPHHVVPSSARRARNNLMSNYS